jgi:ABC-type transport system substrate-binding protein
VRPVDPEEPATCRETVSNLGLTYLGFHAGHEPFSTELVRRAVAHAIDRERFAADLGSIALPAVRGGSIPPAMPGHSHRVTIPYDPEAAARLLDEAGYPGGKGLRPLRLVLPPWTEPAGLAEPLAEVGIRVEPEFADRPFFGDAVEHADMWLVGWTADYPDPEGFFGGLFSVGWPFYRDEEIDAVLARARHVQDQGERMRLFHELDRLWVRERAAIVPMLYPRSNVLSRPWVEGFWANAIWGAIMDGVVVNRDSAARRGAGLQASATGRPS